MAARRSLPELHGWKNLREWPEAVHHHRLRLWRSWLRRTTDSRQRRGVSSDHTLATTRGLQGKSELEAILDGSQCAMSYLEFIVPSQISCTQENDSLNLSPLMKNPKNIIVTESGKEFHINVCNPLVPTPDLDCPHGSAVCRVVKNSKGQYVDETVSIARNS